MTQKKPKYRLVFGPFEFDKEDYREYNFTLIPSSQAKVQNFNSKWDVTNISIDYMEDVDGIPTRKSLSLRNNDFLGCKIKIEKDGSINNSSKEELRLSPDLLIIDPDPDTGRKP